MAQHRTNDVVPVPPMKRLRQTVQEANSTVHLIIADAVGMGQCIEPGYQQKCTPFGPKQR